MSMPSCTLYSASGALPRRIKYGNTVQRCLCRPYAAAGCLPEVVLSVWGVSNDNTRILSPVLMDGLLTSHSQPSDPSKFTPTS